MSQRATASTRLNERSSRSHGIFTMKIEFGQGENDNEPNDDTAHDKSSIKRRRNKIKLKKRAVVHFVDLAGSERQQDFDADRMKESCQINKSLVVLSNVITSLTKEGNNKSRFLHFRDSKLTFYLRDIFGGNSRTAIITNILNEESYYFETFNTLRFSATAKTIKTFPKANFVAEGSEEELQSEINYLMRKLSKYEKERKGATNKEVNRLAKRLKVAWEDVRDEVLGNDIIIKEHMVKFERAITLCISEIHTLASNVGSEKLFKTDIVEIIEEIENFFSTKRPLKRKELILHLAKIEKNAIKTINLIKGNPSINQGAKTARSNEISIHKKLHHSTGIFQNGRIAENVFFDPVPVNHGEDEFDLEKELLKMKIKPSKNDIGLYSYEYVQSLIQRNEEYEKRILQMNSLNSEFIKEFSENVQYIQSENADLKDLLIEKAENLKSMEERLFEYEKGRPMNEEEANERNTDFENYSQNIRNGRLSSQIDSNQSIEKDINIDSTIKISELPDNCFDKLLSLDSKRNDDSDQETQKQIPPLLFEISSPQNINEAKQPDLFKSAKQLNLKQKPTATETLKKQLQFLENLCHSKDDVIGTLQSQLIYAREDEMEAINSIRESIEFDSTKVKSLEHQYSLAQQEISNLRRELVTSSRKIPPKKSQKGSRGGSKVSKGSAKPSRPFDDIRSFDVIDYLAENSPGAASGRRSFRGHTLSVKNSKSRHSSSGRLNKEESVGYPVDAYKTFSSGVKGSFISHRQFKRKIEPSNSAIGEDGLELNLREKNKEIIFYLKEIDKLQNENENLRDNRSSNAHLKAYKLKLQNRKLKEALKKLAGKRDSPKVIKKDEDN